ncbi:hypothetical protein DPMN_170004 [Dreissena polymorpha]|uniref:Uncharacterized protein n=1 Tax=Dreissena polymorpha TaxID=45954 RepID=A0A9D4IDV9_DREPO|nr:hypothetical protein DPMN_170004 [Dreissena polymorpha]
MGDLTDADKKIVALSAVIGAVKTDPGPFLDRSTLFSEKGLYRQALEDAKSALRLEPKHVPALIAAGRAALKLKRFEESYKFLNEGLTLDSKNEKIVESLRLLQDEIVSDYDERAQGIPEKTYKAVELCSQDVYPGDDELYKHEVEILLKKYTIDIADIVKPADVPLSKRKEAASFGVMAYNARSDGRLEEALQCCHVALGKDPGNYRLLHMRAMVFDDLEEPAHALKNLVMIPKPFRFVEAWKLGGKLLQKLKLPVMSEFWLRKATEMVPEADRRKDLEAAMLFQQVRVDRIYGPLTYEFPVKVKFTDYGRAVVATESLKPEENAFDDTPVVIGQLISCIQQPACGHCGNSMVTVQQFFGPTFDSLPEDLQTFAIGHWPDVRGVTCSGCQRERYCSENCRHEAWYRYHRVMCPFVNPAAGDLYELIENRGQGRDEKGKWSDLWVCQYSPIVLAKIWAMIASEAKRLMEERGITEPDTEIWARAKMPFRKFISYGSMSAAQKMPEIFKLMQRIFEACDGTLSYKISEAEFEARYYQATCNLQAFAASVTPKTAFMDNLVKTGDIRALRLLRFLEENDRSAGVSFAGMFPLHACLNHACDNNVYVMDGFVNGKPAVHVRVRRHIRPGDELFTTYIDTAMPRKLRRAWLCKSFNFWCNCRRCQFEGDDSSTCTECKKAASGDRNFPGCSRCRKAWYCSTACQKKAWARGHRDICSLEHTAVQMGVSATGS